MINMYPASYNEVNRIISEKYLDYKNGFYIEVGGSDGVTQSNTWHLEMYKGWTGILVEPNLEAAQKCCANRPNSTVFNYALVSKDCKDSEVKLLRRTVYSDDPGLMSSISDSPIHQNSNWSAPATDIDKTEEFIVPTATLTDILESCEVNSIDFLSLDVEGYEIEVLNGLDLKRFCPKVILIEWHSDIEDIKNLINDTHEMVEQLSIHDYVFLMRQ